MSANAPLRSWWPSLFLAVLPVLVHLPSLSGHVSADPITIVSGLTPELWTTNGFLPGYPWADGNAGVTTEALGMLAARDWLHGILPWWNPYSGIGMPLAAEGQTPAFFLPFVLLLVRPHGLIALIIMLQAIAGLSTRALLHRLALSDHAALLGAILFELNGTFGWLAHGPVLTVAFLPLTLLGLEQARTKARPWALIAGVLWTLLAGFPEAAALNLLFAALWAVLRLLQSPDRRTYALRALLPALAGVLLATPAFWPFLEALPRDFLGRHTGAVTSGLLPGNAALLLFPGLLGAPLAGPVTLGISPALWVRAGGWCDLVLVTLAVAGAIGARRERALALTLLAWITVTALRAAAWPPAIALFSLIPLLRQTAMHAWILPSWSMAATISAAFAADRWLRGDKIPLGRAVLITLPAALLSLVLARPAIAELLGRLPHETFMLTESLAVPVATLAFLFPLTARPANRLRTGLFLASLTASAAVPVILPQLAGTHGRPIDAASIAILQRETGLGRVLPLGPLVPNYGAAYGIPELAHNAEPVPQIWVDGIAARLSPPSFDGVNFAEGPSPAPGRLRAVLPAYQAMGASLAVTLPGFDPFPPGLDHPVLLHRGTAMDIWRLQNPSPYASAPDCRAESASRTRFEVTCSSPSHLTRLELDEPGWHAAVAGRATPIERTGGLFQSVPVPAGTTEIRFFYAPPGIAWAWAACALGFILAALLALRGFGRAPHAPSSPAS